MNLFSLPCPATCGWKCKAIPFQAWTGPEDSTMLRLTDFKTIGTWRWKGCRSYATAAFTPRKYSWYTFLLEAESATCEVFYIYIALLFHDHGTRRGWVVSSTPRPYFTPEKDPVPILQKAGWAPGPVWTGAENLAPTGIRSPVRPARSQSLTDRATRPTHTHTHTYIHICQPFGGILCVELQGRILLFYREHIDSRFSRKLVPTYRTKHRHLPITLKRT
jgi:hypothetical protein